MKPYYSLISLILMLCFLPTATFANGENSNVRCIVIDAGHGGKDPGATNGKVMEKNITLPVALKLGEIIKRDHPHIKIVYTRKDDTFVPLQTRSDIANKAKGDLFISIHVNAAENRSAHGTETFLMGADRKGENLAVAMRENDVITYEEDYTERYEGYVPGSSESYIIFSLMNYAYQTQSLSLASYVQQEFGNNLPLRNRGVKQAGYLVLRNTAMPSILTEIGFISNHEECEFLNKKSNQDKIAQLLANAVGSYIKENGKIGVTYKKNDEKEESPQIQGTENPAVSTESVKNNESVIYRILVVKSKRRIAINSNNFGPFVSVTEEVKQDDYYNYYVEKMFSYKEALLLYNRVKELRPKSQLVAYKNGKAISLDEAKETNP